MVSIVAFQAVDLGSTPGQRMSLVFSPTDLFLCRIAFFKEITETHNEITESFTEFWRMAWVARHVLMPLYNTVCNISHMYILWCVYTCCIGMEYEHRLSDFCPQYQSCRSYSDIHIISWVSCKHSIRTPYYSGHFILQFNGVLIRKVPPVLIPTTDMPQTRVARAY